jgi:hypothetical protein
MRAARVEVRRRLRAVSFGCALLSLALAAPTPAAYASFIVTFSEVGSDVVATGAGSLNLTGLSGPSGGFAGAGIEPISASFIIGPTAAITTDFYDGVVAPSSFGSGSGAAADSGSGDTVGFIAGLGDALAVPSGYSSGTELAATSTYAGETFASLGLTPGVYTFTLPEDTITLIIGAAVPLPATFVLLASAVVGLTAVRNWRRR